MAISAILRVLPQQRERFRENCYPRDWRKGEKCPGEVVGRLIIAGCPPEEVFWCLFSYATDSDRVRKGRRESIRYRRGSICLKLEHALVGAKYLKFKFLHHARSGGTKEVKEAEWVEQIIKGVIAHVRRSRDIGRELKRFGVTPLEYLAMLQCLAEEVGNPLFEVELSELVLAAVSAVHPKARKIETDTLAPAMRRFHKRTPGLKEALKEGCAQMLARYRMSPPLPPR